MIRTRKRLTDVSMSWCIFVVGGGGEAKGDCEFVSGCNCVWSVSVRWSVCLCLLSEVSLYIYRYPFYSKIFSL